MSRSDDSVPRSEGATHSTATSRPLLDRVRAADPAAWNTLVDLYGPLVFTWCRRWDLPEQEIADVFQEVFQAVTAHIATFRKENERDTFRGWLRAITQNKVRDHFRKVGREPGGAGGTEAQLRFAGLPEESSRDDDSADDDAVERALIRRVLDSIRVEFEDRTWQAFWLTTVDGRAANDVGGEIGMSARAVRVAKSRVLRRLREELGE